MNKIILLALVGMGFLVMPFTAQALDSAKIGQNLDREPNMSIAQYVGEASPLENRDR
jgi:energy-converting hydrogenase Eha subunit C